MKYDINIQQVRKMQENIWSVIKKTFGYRKGYGEPLPVYGHYGGIFKAGNDELVMHTDGVGTKLLVAQALEKYDTVGIDAVAMSVNDILCVGAEPLVGVDYLALAKEDDWLVSEVMKGLVKGAEESGCAILGGETAIIPDIIKGGKRPFDLTFTVVGRVKKRILGDQIKKGDVLIGLESSGLHSNGYTLARKALDVEKWGKEMIIPTRIYVAPILEMIDVSDVHGVAHITGGGFSKINRLNKQVGYRLSSLPEPKQIFKALAEKVNDAVEMHRTFNMGVGIVIVAPSDAEGTIINIAKKHDVKAHVIGTVTDKKGVWLPDAKGEVDISFNVG
jgi:phosphoribosylformylglycinamidine cyclo-ligase